jgi:hypothetical protein
MYVNRARSSRGPTASHEAAAIGTFLENMEYAEVEMDVKFKSKILL